MRFVSSRKIRNPPIVHNYQLKSVFPKRETSTVSKPRALRGPVKPEPKSSFSEGSGTRKGSTTYCYTVDLADDKVNRVVRKHCYRTHPSEYLEASRDPKGRPEVQAAYQVARRNLTKIRDLRLQATHLMSAGDNSWRKAAGKLNAVLNNIKKRRFGHSYVVNKIEFKYTRWCIREVWECYANLYGHFGFTESELSFCATRERGVLEKNSSGFRRDVKRLIVEYNTD